MPTVDGYCVSFVKSLGFDYRGDAWQWAKYINSQKPEPSSVVVLNEGPLGHLAYVLAINGDKLWIVEQNYEGRYIISYRTLDIDNPRILGYISK